MPVCRSTALVLAAVALSIGGLGAQTLIADLNTQAPAPDPTGSFPSGFADSGAGWIAFAASGHVRGGQLWRSDGSVAGTVPITDLPIGEVFQPSGFVPVQGGICFAATTLGGGSRLWRSDGTRAGTAPLAVVGLGSPRLLSPFGTRVLFAAGANPLDQRVWISDGTVAGTQALLPSPTPINPSAFVALGNGTPGIVAMFSAVSTGRPADRELWRSDGTLAGTFRVADLEPGSGGSYPQSLTAIGNAVLFAASTGPTGVELWRSDGNPGNATLVLDIAPGAASATPRLLCRAGGLVYFSADDGVHGRELWASDGTGPGTRLVVDLEPGPLGSDPLELCAHGGALVFSASTTTHGREPYRSDGSGTGTVRLADVEPGAGSSDPGQFVSAGAGVWFFATSSAHGREPWRSLGSPATSARVIDLEPGPGSGVDTRPGIAVPGTTLPGGALLFAGDDGRSGVELFVSDGSVAGTRLLADINLAAAASRPSHLLRCGERLSFLADDGVNGERLWSSDGTRAGTQALIAPGATAPEFWNRRAFSDGARAWFVVEDPVFGRELWVSDGTSAGTRLAVDVLAGIGNGSPAWLTRVGSRAFFVAADPFGSALWVSDGTPGGSARVALFLANLPGFVAPHELAGWSDACWFAAGDASHGVELWRSDGSSQGGALAIDVVPGPTSSWPRSLTPLGARLVFVASDPAAGTELYLSDGSPAGTRRIVDLEPGAAGSDPRALIAFGNRVAFLATTQGRLGLWISDGSAAGTRLLRDGLVDPRALTVADDRIFFTERDAASGRELWTSDGTSAGTQRVVDLLPGAAAAIADNAELFPAGSGRRVVFAANEGASTGIELFVSDGSAAGTRRVTDLAEGQVSSAPRAFGTFGLQLAFAAYDPSLGEEPWSIPLRALEASAALAFGAGCPGSNGRPPRLAADGVPRLGETGFALRLDDAKPLSTALVLVDLVHGALELGSGCTLYLVAAPISGSFPIDAQGITRVALAIPTTPTLLGLELAAQAAVFDIGAAWQDLLALSNGIAVLVGR